MELLALVLSDAPFDGGEAINSHASRLNYKLWGGASVTRRTADRGVGAAVRVVATRVAFASIDNPRDWEASTGALLGGEKVDTPRR
jgi:hypothetical protein